MVYLKNITRKMNKYIVGKSGRKYKKLKVNILKILKDTRNY